MIQSLNFLEFSYFGGISAPKPLPSPGDSVRYFGRLKNNLGALTTSIMNKLFSVYRFTLGHTPKKDHSNAICAVQHFVPEATLTNTWIDTLVEKDSNAITVSKSLSIRRTVANIWKCTQGLENLNAPNVFHHFNWKVH